MDKLEFPRFGSKAWIKTRMRIGYTPSRESIDKFLFKNKHLLIGDVLDVGGTKNMKSGLFDLNKLINQQNINVKYLNIDSSSNPDFLCSAEEIPVSDDLFDVIIFSETLEHLENPTKVLNEIFRVLKPEGKLIMTTPFMFRLHHVPGIPYDFQRWTKYKISRELFNVGFGELTTVTELNNAFVLILDVIYQLVDHIKFLKFRAFIGIILIPMKILILDFLSIKLKSSDYLNSFSTHYGTIAIKPKDK